MTIGHNSIEGEQLASFIQRIERLEEDKAQVMTDISEVYKEAKDAGYDPKIMRLVVKERKLSAQQRQTLAALMDTYRNALGMLADTELGRAAMDLAKMGATVSVETRS